MSLSLERAIETFLARKARKVHPEGSFDVAGRWEPSESEWRPCCRDIRRPSKRFPYSLNRHCRSAEHIAHLFEVDPSELRAAIRKASKK